jgi:hypothetical protein
MTEESIEAISEISPVVLMDALNLRNSLTKNKTSTIQRDFLPRLALACCIGTNTEPREEIQTLKEFTKLNDKCKEPLEEIKATMLLEETRENLVYYLDEQIESRREFDENKKQKAFEKKQQEIEEKKQQEIEKKELEKQSTREEIIQTAASIYYGGDFIEYCQDTFRKIWYGDSHVLEMMLYQSANARLKNPDDGIHLHAAGKTQAGKSEAIKSALLFVHPDDKINKKFTKAWIYYTNEIHPRTILFSDDTTLSEDEAEFFRAILTSWKTGCDRGTVKNQEVLSQHIPPRISMIFTSIESVSKETDDAQDESRFLTINVMRSIEDEERIRKFMQEEHEDISEELEIIYTAWDFIEPNKIEVKLHRTFEEKLPFREFKRFLTLMRARALLLGRNTTTEDDVIAIKNVLTYSTPMINSETAGLTQNEKKVYECIPEGKWITTIEIQTITGLTVQSVYKALRGKRGRFDSPINGILSKMKVYHEVERNENTNDIHKFKRFSVGSGENTKIS